MGEDVEWWRWAWSLLFTAMMVGTFIMVLQIRAIAARSAKWMAAWEKSQHLSPAQAPLPGQVGERGHRDQP